MKNFLTFLVGVGCLSLLSQRLPAQQVHYRLPKQLGVLGGPARPEEFELGRKLFYDKRLSVDGTVACATCHDPHMGFTDGLRVSRGVRDQFGTMNAPTILNASYSPLQFWNGRTVGQNTQALLPLVNPVEMGNLSEQQVINRLRLIKEYVIAFAEIFGIDVSTGNSITAPRLARVVVAFESNIISFDSPFDRYMAGKKEALSEDAKIGMQIFLKANCMACHQPPLYTDNAVHNNGMEVAGKLRITDNGRYGDLLSKGRQNEARNSDVRAFKTPTLRNLKDTAPYNHAGTFNTVRRCVLHYNRGGVSLDGRRDRYMDQRIKSLGLSDSQVNYLAIFLEEGLVSLDYPLIEEPVLP